MIPILYPKGTTSFTGEGLGRLSGSISAHALTVINSTYEIDIIYPIDGVHFSEIEEGSIILAPHDESGTLEPYEVYAISRPMNGKVVINAWHVSYQLRGIVAKPFTGQSLYSGLSALKQACMTTNNFTFSTTRAVSSPITTTVPMVVRSALGGVEGSFLDVYGGEWDFTGFNCILKSRLGQDTDIRIKYGINLMDATKKTTINNFWTGVVPYWTSDAGNVYYNGVIWSEYADTLGFHVSIPVDCTGDFETEPTQAQMLTWGQTYIANNAKSQIPTSIDVSFAALWQTEEYKDIAALQRLSLGDTVTIEYKALGIENTARIVSTDYDILNERYSKMTIGQVRANIAQKLSDDVKEVTKNLPSKDWFEQRLAEDVALITGNKGGYVVLNRNADGEPEEIVIMDTPSIYTAVYCIRMNKSGIGFSTNGYAGNYNSVWTINGTFDAQMINVINLNASNINTGTLSGADINIGNGAFTVDSSGNVTSSSLSMTGGKIVMTSNSESAPTAGYICLKKNDSEYTTYNSNGFAVRRSVNNVIKTSQILNDRIILQTAYGTFNLQGYAANFTMTMQDASYNYSNMKVGSFSIGSIGYDNVMRPTVYLSNSNGLELYSGSNLTRTAVYGNGFLALYINGTRRAQLSEQGLTFWDAGGNITKQYAST